VKARQKLKKAQAIYQEARYFECLEKLQESLACFGSDEPPNQNLMASLPKVYQCVRDCYLQSASCYIRLEEFQEAIIWLNIILGIEPECVKALFLRALAYEDMRQPEKALADFIRAHELSPADQTIKSYLTRCRQSMSSG
jgi:tetratricopeptide (TPR) repeat protein